MDAGLDIQKAFKPSGNGSISSQRTTPAAFSCSAATAVSSVTTSSPLVQAHAADPEWILYARAGSGNKTVERHGNCEAQLGHD